MNPPRIRNARMRRAIFDVCATKKDKRNTWPSRLTAERRLIRASVASAPRGGGSAPKGTTGMTP